MELTHLDETGAARMVDVGEKAVTRRTACAQSVITMKPETLRMICEDRAPKGDVLRAHCGHHGREKDERAYPDVPSHPHREREDRH